jgi:FkbM family methyltransferase
MVLMSVSLTIYRKVRDVLGGHGIEYVFPINLIHRKIQARVKTNKAVVHGHIMDLDPIDSLCLSIDEDFEKEETRVIREHVHEGDVVIDIGANIGFHTLEFARLVGKRGRVYAFEPDPNNFKILTQNILQNHYQNVKTENVAVMDAKGKIKLFLCEDNHGDHRSFDSGDGRKFTLIKGVKLDEYFDTVKIKIDFIKIDIQGSEFRALKGMEKIIMKQKKLKLMTEFWPEGLKMAGIKPMDYLKLLKAYGFRLMEMDKKGHELIELSSTGLLKKYSINKDAFTNILGIKE